MPLLTPQNKVQRDEFKCKLPVEVIADIEAYALAIDSDKDYVVQKAIERLTADKEFQQWKSSHQDQVTKTSEAKAKRGPKPKSEATELKIARSA